MLTRTQCKVLFYNTTAERWSTLAGDGGLGRSAYLPLELRGPRGCQTKT